jgi:hypothetical protein
MDRCPETTEAPIVRPVQPRGWERFFADDRLVLPDDFLLGDDPVPQDRDSVG